MHCEKTHLQTRHCLKCKILFIVGRNKENNHFCCMFNHLCIQITQQNRFLKQILFINQMCAISRILFKNISMILNWDNTLLLKHKVLDFSKNLLEKFKKWWCMLVSVVWTLQQAININININMKMHDITCIRYNMMHSFSSSKLRRRTS